MKIENRQKLVRVSIKKSRKSLEAAATLLRDGFSESAVSRAYYAAFYLAQAALATKDISRNKHSGVIAAFGQSLTKTSTLPENLHKLLISLYELRITSDYSIEDEPSIQEAKEAFEKAKKFATAVEPYLESWLNKGLG